ncbi:MAG: ABC transporter substrate-binding protein [Acidimicrobiia bacterium]|nr:ABC transporter substrate-binding protein [Acidimicrobiia bacterium]
MTFGRVKSGNTILWRLLALLVALSMVVAACGGDDDSADGAGEETTTEADAAEDETTDTTEDTADESEADAAEDETADGAPVEVPGLVEEGKLIVVTTGNFPPFTAINPDTGDNEGYTIDIAKEIAARTGLELELPTVDFVAELEGLSQGLYDIADSGIWPTEERQESFAFSRPMTSTGIIAQVRAEDADSAGLDDLTGLNAGGIQGSSQEAYIRENQEALGYTEYFGFTGAGEALTALKQGRVDALSQDSLVAAFAAANDPELAIAGPTVAAHPLSLAFQLEMTDKRDAIDIVLNEMIEDGTLAEIQKTWFGQCIPVPDDVNAVEPYTELPAGDC